MKRVSAVLCGFLFGLGLAVSQMSDPHKVLSFLDVTGDWDPSLLLVLGGAVAVTAVAFRFVLRMPRPLFDRTFEPAPPERITSKLVIGAGIFGVGWGLSGFCPGPGVVALPSLPLSAASFLATFFIGSALYRTLLARPKREAAGSTTIANVEPTT